MLWRGHYETRILRDLSCPVPVSGPEIWIAGFEFDGLATQGVWWRLFESDFPGDSRVKKVLIFPGVGPETKEAAMSMVPPSEQDRLHLLPDPEGLFRNLLDPGNQSAFAAIVETNSMPLVMVGPPTEDAWEEFSREWRLRT